MTNGERWQGAVDATLNEMSTDIKEIRDELREIHRRQLDNPYIGREEYDAKHEDLERRVELNTQSIANLQGRALVMASTLSILVAGLISLAANYS